MQSLHIETGFPIFIYWKIIHFVRQRCVHGQALLDWPFGVGQKAANPQGDQKLNTKAILISQFVKHTHVLDKIQIGQLYRFSSTSALPKGWNLAARSCLESAQQVLIIENNLKTHSWRTKLQKCNVCDFASVQTIYLRNHMKTHSGEKSRKCKICNFESVQTVYLRNHLKPFGDKSHKCNACDFDSIWDWKSQKCNECNIQESQRCKCWRGQTWNI